MKGFTLKKASQASLVLSIVLGAGLVLSVTLLQNQQRQDVRSRASETPKACTFVSDTSNLVAGPVNLQSANLLINPGFESGNTGWVDWGNATAAPGNAHSASYSLRTGTANGGRAQTVSSISSNAYVLSGWGKVSKPGEIGYIGVHFYNTSNTKIGENALIFTGTSYEYKLMDIRPAAGTAYVKVYVWKNAGTGYFYADDISYTRMMPPVVVSTSQVTGPAAVATYKQNAVWTTTIPGATWIWSSYRVQNPEYDETKAFVKTFYAKTPADSAVLNIAADNNYWVYLNGELLHSNTTTTYKLAIGYNTYNLASKIKNGMNTLRIHVRNVGAGSGATPEANPAGLLYKLMLRASDCGLTAPAPTQPQSTVQPTNQPTNQPTSQPTAEPTLPAGVTSLNLDLLLHGIGKGGDNVNPQGNGNPAPLHPQREVTVEVYNANNTLVMTSIGTVTLSSASGSFKGTINLGTSLPQSGPYTVKVKSRQYLKALVPGIQNLTVGTANTLPQTVLLTGDINNDNAINILDYNLLMGCYSDLSPAANCSE